MARPVLIKSGLGLLIISTVAGVAPTVIGMASAFKDAASKEAVDASILSRDIGNAMLWTASFIPVAFIGLCLLVAGLILVPRHRSSNAEQDDSEGTMLRGGPDL